jgi:hypothetical protein
MPRVTWGRPKPRPLAGSNPSAAARRNALRTCPSMSRLDRIETTILDVPRQKGAIQIPPDTRSVRKLVIPALQRLFLVRPINVAELGQAGVARCECRRGAHRWVARAAAAVELGHGSPPMRPSAALCLGALGLALVHPGKGSRLAFAVGLAVYAFAVGGLGLILINLDPGIDPWLAPRTAADGALPFPGRRRGGGCTWARGRRTRAELFRAPSRRCRRARQHDRRGCGVPPPRLPDRD